MLALALMLAVWPALGQGADRDARAVARRLKAATDAAWPKLLQDWRKVQATISLRKKSQKVPNFGDIEHRFVHEVSFASDGQLAQVKGTKDGTETRWIINERYAFSMTKRTAQTQWQLAKVIPGGTPLQISATAWAQMGRFHRGMNVYNISVTELLTDSRYRLLEATERENGKIIVARWEYDVPHTEPKLEEAPRWPHAKYTAEVLLHPVPLVTSAKVEYPEPKPGIRTVQNEFQDYRGVPFLKQSKTKFIDDKNSKQVLEEDTVEVSDLRDAIAGKEEYYLPYYGIPETVIASYPTSWTNWLTIGILAGCIVLFLILAAVLKKKFGR